MKKSQTTESTPVVITGDVAEQIIQELEANPAAEPTPAPDRVTPKTLAEMFQVDQKVVRRHLRKHFGTDHEAKGSWGWAKDDPALKAILDHFKAKYPTQSKAQ